MSPKGQILILLKIDEMGRVSNYRVKRGINPLANQYAQSLVATIPGEWVPAFLNGKAVAADHIISLSYNYEVTVRRVETQTITTTSTLQGVRRSN